MKNRDSRSRVRFDTCKRTCSIGNRACDETRNPTRECTFLEGKRESPRTGSGVARDLRTSPYILGLPLRAPATTRGGNEADGFRGSAVRKRIIRPAVEVIEEILESPGPRDRVAPIRFRRDDFWLTWHTSEIPTWEEGDKEEIESVRMEQPDRFRKEGTVLSRSMDGSQTEDYTWKTEHEGLSVFLNVRAYFKMNYIKLYYSQFLKCTP